jgi:hypothetical protein
MPDAETTTLLRAVHDEVCAHVSKFDTNTKLDVASRLLESVKQGRSSVDDLRRAGQEALRQAPTMWR